MTLFEQILEEAYHQTNIDEIVKFVNECKKYVEDTGNEDLTDPNILEHIGTFTDAFDVCFDATTKMIVSEYSYDPPTHRTELTVGPNFLSIFKNPNFDINKLIKSMSSYFTHEHTHMQQDQSPFSMSNYVQSKDNIKGSLLNQPVEYFMQNVEIDAYARELAYMCKDQGKDANIFSLGYLKKHRLSEHDLEEFINSFKFIDNDTFEKFTIYYTHRHTHPQQWNRFMREFYNYFHEAP
jgi:hypothetical protein